MSEDNRAAVLDFLDALLHQRRASPHTLDAYRHDLERLLNFAEGKSLRELRPPDLRAKVRILAGQGLSPRSIARVLSAWRSLFRWLTRTRGYPHNPCEGLRAPRAPRTLPNVLSPDQAAALLDSPATDLQECRDRAMFELLYSSGLRVSELASLDCTLAAEIAQGEITVTGKRNKTRRVPVGRQAR
jgi:integrase/recombinase XerC